MPIEVIWPLVPTPALLPCRGYARDTLEREEAGGVRLVWRSRLLAGRPAQQGRWTESPRAPGRIRDSRDGDGEGALMLTHQFQKKYPQPYPKERTTT